MYSGWLVLLFYLSLSFYGIKKCYSWFLPNNITTTSPLLFSVVSQHKYIFFKINSNLVYPYTRDHKYTRNIRMIGFRLEQKNSQPYGTQNY